MGGLAHRAARQPWKRLAGRGEREEVLMQHLAAGVLARPAHEGRVAVEPDGDAPEPAERVRAGAAVIPHLNLDAGELGARVVLGDRFRLIGPPRGALRTAGHRGAHARVPHTIVTLPCQS